MSRSQSSSCGHLKLGKYVQGTAKVWILRHRRCQVILRSRLTGKARRIGAVDLVVGLQGNCETLGVDCHMLAVGLGLLCTLRGEGRTGRAGSIKKMSEERRSKHKEFPEHPAILGVDDSEVVPHIS